MSIVMNMLIMTQAQDRKVEKKPTICAWIHFLKY